MKSVYLNFLKKIIIFSVAFALICYAVGYFLPAGYVTPVLPYLFVFFFSVTLAVHYVLLKASEKKLSKFSINFLLLTFIKLMLYFGVILTYVFIYRNDAANFIITFFIFYLLYTSFEVISIVRKTDSELPDDKLLDKV